MVEEVHRLHRKMSRRQTVCVVSKRLREMLDPLRCSHQLQGREPQPTR